MDNSLKFRTLLELMAGQTHFSLELCEEIVSINEPPLFTPLDI